MSLSDKLQEIRDMAAQRFPEETRKLIGRANEELKNSGISDRALKIGAQLPSFELKNTQGGSVSSSDLLAESNLVLTFYRGVW